MSIPVALVLTFGGVASFGQTSGSQNYAEAVQGETIDQYLSRDEVAGMRESMQNGRNIGAALGELPGWAGLAATFANGTHMVDAQEVIEEAYANNQRVRITLEYGSTMSTNTVTYTAID
ncbi:hypothetical protein ABC345_09625 [Shouchella sp. 1P09AA]|uniref:hypothetical protein n=1 Tax=unclassified Shouchella TaxID=2893065 RepID=UPI0039A3F7CF